VTGITLLTQEDCGYCEHAKAVLARIGSDHPIEVTEIDITGDEGRRLAARAGVVFAPGLLVDGRPFGYGRISERRLRRTLQRLAAEAR
jgi:glutaredoxin